MEVSGPAPEAVLLFPWTQAKAEKLPGHFPPCLVHSSDIDLMVVVDSCHLFIHSQDGAFIEHRCEVQASFRSLTVKYLKWDNSKQQDKLIWGNSGHTVTEKEVTPKQFPLQVASSLGYIWVQ